MLLRYILWGTRNFDTASTWSSIWPRPSHPLRCVPTTGSKPPATLTFDGLQVLWAQVTDRRHHQPPPQQQQQQKQKPQQHEEKQQEETQQEETQQEEKQQEEQQQEQQQQQQQQEEEEEQQQQQPQPQQPQRQQPQRQQQHQQHQQHQHQHQQQQLQQQQQQTFNNKHSITNLQQQTFNNNNNNNNNNNTNDRYVQWLATPLTTRSTRAIPIAIRHKGNDNTKTQSQTTCKCLIWPRMYPFRFHVASTIVPDWKPSIRTLPSPYSVPAPNHSVNEACWNQWETMWQKKGSVQSPAGIKSQNVEKGFGILG